MEGKGGELKWKKRWSNTKGKKKEAKEKREEKEKGRRMWIMTSWNNIPALLEGTEVCDYVCGEQLHGLPPRLRRHQCLVLPTQAKRENKESHLKLASLRRTGLRGLKS